MKHAAALEEKVSQEVFCHSADVLAEQSIDEAVAGTDAGKAAVATTGPEQDFKKEDRTIVRPHFTQVANRVFSG